jgi:hypothetical protein
MLCRATINLTAQPATATSGPQRNRQGIMQTFLYYLTQVAAAAVLIVLFMGLWTMLRGSNPNLSQKLMRLRVLLQLFAIIAIALFVYLTRA